MPWDPSNSDLKALPLKSVLPVMTRLPLLALVLLLALCGGASWSLWPHAWGAPAVDLFRYWAIGAVHQAFPGQLGSPYGAVDAYSQALMAMLGAGSQRELLKTAEVALPFDLTASPLHYYLYALAPPDYLQFLRAYRWVQVAGAAGAVMLLATVASGRRGFPVLFAGLLCFAHDGLLLDVNVGNTNALQLLLLALVTLVSPRLAAAPAVASGAVGAVLALLVLFKPTLALAVGLLALANLAGLDRPRRNAGFAGALASGLLLVLLSSLYFGGFAVWFDWLRELTSSSARMAYPLSSGNVSLVSYLYARTACPIPLLMLLLAALLLASLWLARHIGPPGVGVRDILKAPLLASSTGILMTLALSPLVWEHYLVLLLLPTVLLMFARESSRTTVCLASVALFLGLGIGRRLFLWNFGLSVEAVALCLVLAWVPAWLALLCAVHRGAGSRDAAAHA